MIQPALLLITKQLNDYLKNLSANQSAGNTIVVGNIAMSSANGGDANYMDNKIVVSIVNLMEESSLRNTSAHKVRAITSELENPPIFINAYLLFTANFIPEKPESSSPGMNYLNGVMNLVRVMEFFQGKNIFSIKNSPSVDFIVETPSLEAPPVELQDLSIKLEMVSLSFEQVNYLWGSLGGKQMPFVLFKAHIIPVKRPHLLNKGGVIQDIQPAFLHHQNEAS